MRLKDNLRSKKKKISDFDAYKFYLIFVKELCRIKQKCQAWRFAVDSPWMLKLKEMSGLSSHLNSRLLRSGLLSKGRIDLLTFRDEN